MATKKKASTRSARNADCPYQVGSAWIFRSVTHYNVGIVTAIVGGAVVLGEACWVADTGRYHVFLRDGWVAAVEVEPYPGDGVCVVERGAIVDAQPWTHGPGRKVIG